MFFNRYFWPSFTVLIITDLFHIFACQFDFYETLTWYDILMHFLGGLWVYLFLLWIAHTQYGARLLPHASKGKLLIAVLVVGVLWEVLELVLHFTSFDDPRYIPDTPIDLVMDFLGAFAGSWLYKK